MAKLNKATAKKVGDAEGKSFEALPEGKYPAYLKAVDSDKQGPAGPYWAWTFVIDDPDDEAAEFNKRQLFINTSLADDALWKMQEVFDAYGVPYDTDTDDLCGKSKHVLLIVVQRVIEKGARKGEMGNDVQRVLPLDSDEADGPAGDIDDGF